VSWVEGDPKSHRLGRFLAFPYDTSASLEIGTNTEEIIVFTLITLLLSSSMTRSSVVDPQSSDSGPHIMKS